MPKNTLKRSVMLKKREDFISIFKQGKRLRNDAFILSFLVYSSNTPKVYSGFTAPKRYLKKAVHRNRVKRLLREVYRCNKHNLEAIALQQNLEIKLLIGYSDKLLPNFTQCNEKISQLIYRLENALIQRTNENQ